jgi:hypothetical protein
MSVCERTCLVTLLLFLSFASASVAPRAVLDMTRHRGEDVQMSCATTAGFLGISRLYRNLDGGLSHDVLYAGGTPHWRDDRFAVYRVGGNYTLAIRDLRLDDAGRYMFTTGGTYSVAEYRLRVLPTTTTHVVCSNTTLSITRDVGTAVQFGACIALVVVVVVVAAASIVWHNRRAVPTYLVAMF